MERLDTSRPLPLWAFAVRRRAWLGWWDLVPIAMLVLWTWLNPRLFPRPSSTSNWGSKAVIGERIWLNRDKVATPNHHRLVPNVPSTVAGADGSLVAWGLVELAIWPTSLGTALIFLGKLWFVDRMVWLFEEVKDATSESRIWTAAASRHPPQVKVIDELAADNEEAKP